MREKFAPVRPLTSKRSSSSRMVGVSSSNSLRRGLTTEDWYRSRFASIQVFLLFLPSWRKKSKVSFPKTGFAVDMIPSHSVKEIRLHHSHRASIALFFCPQPENTPLPIVISQTGEVHASQSIPHFCFPSSLVRRRFFPVRHRRNELSIENRALETGGHYL